MINIIKIITMLMTIMLILNETNFSLLELNKIDKKIVDLFLHFVFVIKNIEEKIVMAIGIIVNMEKFRHDIY